MTLLLQMLSRCERHAFAKFTELIMRDERDEQLVRPLSAAGEQVYFHPLLNSYGGSLHEVYVVHYSPLNLFSQYPPGLVHDPVLAQRLTKIREMYARQVGYWGMVWPSVQKARKLQALCFLTNLSGLPREEYEARIIPAYAGATKAERVRAEQVRVGSYDSFWQLDSENFLRATANFFGAAQSGLRISVATDNVRVAPFYAEANLTGGVLPSTLSPCETVYLDRKRNDDEALQEFEALLNRASSESELETFLKAHYKLLLGPEYDRVETQLWLRFPDLDIGDKERRLDVFVRNSVTRDWDLYELKRSTLPVARISDGIPNFSRRVHAGIQQLRAYARILNQDAVRRQLAKDGIDYCEPELSLIIGRQPNIPLKQWRWLLKSTSAADVRVLTYDRLLSETHVRARDRLLLLNGTQP